MFTVACSIPNLPDFLNLLKNRKNAYITTEDDTVEDIESRLKHTQETVKLDVPTHKYSVEDFVFDKSVTEIVGKVKSLVNLQKVYLNLVLWVMLYWKVY